MKNLQLQFADLAFGETFYFFGREHLYRKVMHNQMETVEGRVLLPIEPRSIVTPTQQPN